MKWKQSKWKRALAALLICGMIAPMPVLPASAAMTDTSAGVEVQSEDAVPEAAGSVGNEVVVGNTENPNLSLNATISASGQEADSVAAAKAKDGSTTTHWGSATNNGPHWLQLAWETDQTIKEIVVHWERRNATSYKLQKSADGSDWEDVEVYTAVPSVFRQRIKLETAITTKYLRVYIESFERTADKENGTSVTWTSVGVMEFETYANDLGMTNQEVADSLEIPTRLEGDALENGKMKMPTMSGYTIEFIGADYEQVLDRDGTIYEPLVDKTVKMNFKITKDADNSSVISKEYSTVVPGKKTPAEGDNPQPSVIPELAEWKGGTGNFTISNGSRIVVPTKDKDALGYVAEEFKKDYKDIIGTELTIVNAESSDLQAGDFFFTLSGNTNEGLKDEGYYMNITDKIEVRAEKNAGIYWSTRTILQILKQNGTTIPQGETRDYPKYSVRSFSLDLARRPFSKTIVDEMIKTMAWYKMNDINMHLNDNLIFLEDYATTEGAMSAYEGFRLESDIKRGGNGGKNMADLTSDDIAYTKSEMRDMIQNYRKLGINVVPEFDTPAHSLSFTKVRPDLRMGTNARENDHFNLDDKYEESLTFVKDLWNEYFDGENPVFDGETIINVGTDEYSARFTEEFRRFTDDMLEYGQTKVKRVRLWGSLTMRSGTTDVRSQNVEMLMWNRPWAQPLEMYEKGYKMIDINDAQLYIVPAAGYYYDYLNKQFLYNSYDPARNMGLPVGSDQVLGGAYAIWNDMVDKRANGLSEMQIYDRFWDAAGMIAYKLWGETRLAYQDALALRNELGAAPRTNAYDEVAKQGDTLLSYNFEGNLNDSSENSNNATAGANTTFENGTLKLSGGESYVTTPVNKIGSWGDGEQLTFDIELTEAAQPGDIIFEADAEYNTHDIRIMADGTLGFTREGYDYSFGYTLPVNKKVTLTIEATQNATQLYTSETGLRAYVAVGSFTYEGDLKKSGITNSAMSLPLGRIGSKTNAITAKIDNVTVGAVPERDWDANAIPSTDFQVTSDNEQPGGEIGKAFDNDPETNWHSKWDNEANPLPAEIIIDMGQDYAVEGLYYQTRTVGTNGNITKFSLYYEDEEGNWQIIEEDATWSASIGEKTLYFLEPISASKIKMVVKEGVGDFGSAAEIKLLEAEHVDLAVTAEGGGTATVSRTAVPVGMEVTFKADGGESHDFIGWYDASGQQVSTEANYQVAAETSMTLTARFEIKVFDVTVDGETTSVEYGSTIDRPQEPTAPEGQVFVGWEVEGTGEIFDFTTPITSDLVLTAKFTDESSAVTVTVTIDGREITVISGNTITKPAEPAKTGYKFLGWEVEGTGEIFNFDTPVTEDLVLTAKFEILTFTVTIDGKKNTVNYGGTVAKPAEPKKDGYKFLGWADAAGKIFDFSTKITSDLVLTAKFEEIKDNPPIDNPPIDNPPTDDPPKEDPPKEKPWIFTDVDINPGIWKYESVKYVYYDDIMGAISGTTLFQPDRPLSRSMFATVLYRMADSPAVTYADTFSDVPAGKWYSDAIIWANQKGIVQGMSDGSFGIDNNITREQIAKMLFEYADKVCGFNVSDKKDLAQFTDADAVSNWAVGYMQWATAVEMITGKPNDAAQTSFRMDPKGEATRAECAAMLMRFENKYVNNVN